MAFYVKAAMNQNPLQHRDLPHSSFLLNSGRCVTVAIGMRTGCSQILEVEAPHALNKADFLLSR